MSRLTEIQERLQDTDAAITTMERAIAEDPHSPSLQLMAVSLQKQQRRLEAEFLATAVEIGIDAEAESLEWVSRHLDELRVRYGGRWIGVLGNGVVASSSDLPGLMEALQQAGARDAFITQIPVEELIWRAVYGRQVP